MKNLNRAAANKTNTFCCNLRKMNFIINKMKLVTEISSAEAKHNAIYIFAKFNETNMANLMKFGFTLAVTNSGRICCDRSNISIWLTE
jgi:hypothetical protein